MKKNTNELISKGNVTIKNRTMKVKDKTFYLLKSGIWTSNYNDVINEKRRIEKRRKKNKQGRKTRRQQRIAKLRKKNG